MDINPNINTHSSVTLDKTTNIPTGSSQQIAQNTGEFTAPSKTALSSALNSNAPTSPFSSILQNFASLISQLTGSPKQASTTAPTQNTTPANYADSLVGLQASNMTSPADAAQRIASLDASNNAQLSSIYDDLNATNAAGEPTAAASTLRAALESAAGLTGPATAATRTLNGTGPGNNIEPSRLQAALILASADDNFTLNIRGNVTTDTTIRVFPTNDLTVNAEGSQFISDGIDGDLISIEARQGTNVGPENDDIDIAWSGGAFDISNSLTALADSPLIGQFGPTQSGVITDQSRRDDIASRRGTAPTSDGLSIRGTNNNEVQHLKTAEVSNVRVVGLPVEDLTADFEDLETSEPGREFWPNAGGDSGLFIQGVNRADIIDNELFGIRDAGIYVTASGIEADDDPETTTNFGSNYTLTGNRVSNSFDGISSKRGVDNLVINDNIIDDVVTAISTKKTLDDPDNNASKSNFVSIFDNTIRGATRGILLEATNVASVRNNSITDIGQLTGGLRFASNSSERGTFEGIVLEGVTSTASNDGSTNEIGVNHEIIDNEISVTTDTAQLAALSTLDGVVSRFIGIAQRDFFQQGNVQTDGEFLPVSANPSLPTGNTITGFGTGRVIDGGQDVPDPRSDLTGSAAPRVNRVSFEPTENLATQTSR